ncbi:acyl carrier protein [Rickettsia endosymbiont of Cardiosporidium cionae]|uniref:acyl carrier protein n=1 Tax=Rickettsia endosymbiont of Cardiosporidium cionae TaxID=2777155 RepID=UPI001894FD63|nr:acyl carrier protein [Rickettsia endosymbiont of Cardiosporidium cionae]KAF8818615.1 acyl carrier protein [Rickettsia endosymbiont of Cardiosporidium cionae]
MKEGIEQKVIQMIIDTLKLKEEKVEVTLESKLKSDLGADSLDTVELMMAFEEAFGCNISEEESEGIVTVEDLINYIKSKTGNDL